MCKMKKSNPQILWAMVDTDGFIFPYSVRYLRKDVIDYLNREEAGMWKYFKGIGREIVKIETKLHVPLVTPDTAENKETK